MKDVIANGRFPHGCVLACLFLTTPSIAWADEAQTLTVLGSRIAGSGDGVVLTHEDLTRYPAASLLTALSDVAGVRATSSAGLGGDSFLSINGGRPNFTLVLLDGVRLNNPTNATGSGFTFTQIDPLMIDRVEVSRSALSAVQGSDAISGAISMHVDDVQTATGRMSAHMLTGSDGRLGGGARLDQGWRDGGIVVTGSWYDSGDGDPTTSLKRAQGLLRVNQQWGGYQLRAFSLYSHSDTATFPTQSGGPLYAANRALQSDVSDFTANAVTLDCHACTHLRPHVQVSYVEQDDDQNVPAIPKGVLSSVPQQISVTRLSRLDTLADLAWMQGPFSLVLGGEAQHEYGHSNGALVYSFASIPANYRFDRTTLSGFGELGWQVLHALTINYALRYDTTSDDHSAWTQRIGLDWTVKDGGPRLFIRYGEGFKVPSLYAIYNPLTGNPGLIPERSFNAEAGGSWSPVRGISLSVTGYLGLFHNLIDFDTATFKLVNRSRVTVQGVNGEARWDISPRLSVKASVGTLAMSSPVPLLQRPTWQGNIRAQWHVAPPLTLTLTGRANSSYYDTSVPTGQIILPGHGEADLNAQLRMARHVELDLVVYNLGDTHAQTAIGFPDRGRQAQISLTYR